jgi:hypothetical protein
MTCIKRLILDVLKPHHPNALEFAAALAEVGEQMRIKLRVEAVDEKTESATVIIEDENIDFEAISTRIAELGGSIHSIDEVEVEGRPTTDND